MKSIAIRAAAIVLAAVIVLAAAGCAGEPLTTREKGTLLGGGLGAATGSIIGAAVGSPGAGAAIGGGLGAVTGALVGNELMNHEDREKQIEARLREQQRAIEEQRREIERLEQEPTGCDCGPRGPRISPPRGPARDAARSACSPSQASAAHRG